MRYLKLFLFLLLLHSAKVNAELPPLGENYWSLWGGAVISRMSSGNYVTAYHRGFALGATYATAISELTPFYFESGLFMVRRSVVDYGYIGGYDEQYEIESYNLELPFSILFRLNVSARAAIALCLGGYLSVAMWGEIDDGTNSFNPYVQSSLAVRELSAPVESALFHRFDAGPRVGFSLFVSNFTINFSTAVGLVNIFTRDLREQSYLLQSKSLNFLVGYSF